MKEFVLITLDEYTSLLSSRKSFNYEKKLNSVSKDTLVQGTKPEDIKNSQIDTQDKNNSESDEDKKLCTQLNLNSRLTQAQSRKHATPDDTLADRTRTIAKTDKIVLDLLSSGLSGGKVERARQILLKVDQCSVVSIDGNSGRLMFHERDLDLTVFNFLNDLKTTTKNLNEGTLDLVRRLKLPNFLLANTHAKRVATKVAAYDSNDKEEIGGCSTAKWLRLYWANQIFVVISFTTRHSFLSSWLFRGHKNEAQKE